MATAKFAQAIAIMMIELFDHQKEALEKLESGCILCGGVGSGKSRTALAYYMTKETRCDIFVITTAKKRDSAEWIKEAGIFLITSNREKSIDGRQLVVDSWNNIKNYVGIEGAFFIFDEQKAIGSGVWAKSFIKIARKNHFLVLTATPGDNWLDYIPIFIANGFYKNRTEFLTRHVIYSRYSTFPKIERFVDTARLEYFRNKITVVMPFVRPTISHHEDIFVDYDEELFSLVFQERWNPFDDAPIENVSAYYYMMRRVVNSDRSRFKAVLALLDEHPRAIIFYSFDYELEILKEIHDAIGIPIFEWNGHKHDNVPQGETWAYLVQYTAGAEGWECITTDTTIFYSQSYSYKTMTQSAGRIDRLNTPYRDLYFYHLKSHSYIDSRIDKALAMKEDFNERADMDSRKKHAI